MTTESVRPFEYGCENGHRETFYLKIVERDIYIGRDCSECMAPLRRRFSFSPGAMFHAHYSPFLGKRVDSERQFATALDRASEEATMKTGIPHKYVKRDLQDLRAPDTDSCESALRSTHDAKVKAGKIEPTNKVLY